MIDTDDYLQMSGIQHFSFCRRQWALAYLESQWAEDVRTAEGRILHERCHDDNVVEKRGDLFTVRGLRVISHRLRMSGICDVVEFKADKNGIRLNGRDGLWIPFPIEYKHGSPKQNDADRLQLCAQAMALEEMLVCDIPKGAIYYAETRRRETVDISDELRSRAQAMAKEMNEYYLRGYTPKVKPGKHCNACSLKELCLPKLCGNINVNDYISSHIYDDSGAGTL